MCITAITARCCKLVAECCCCLVSRDSTKCLVVVCWSFFFFHTFYALPPSLAVKVLLGAIVRDVLEGLPYLTQRPNSEATNFVVCALAEVLVRRKVYRSSLPGVCGCCPFSKTRVVRIPRCSDVANDHLGWRDVCARDVVVQRWRSLWGGSRI